MSQEILVKVPYTGQIERFSPLGIGAYPYDCRAKDKFPRSMIYQSEAGGWVASHQLQATSNGHFVII